MAGDVPIFWQKIGSGEAVRTTLLEKMGRGACQCSHKFEQHTAYLRAEAGKARVSRGNTNILAVASGSTGSNGIGMTKGLLF